jgi:hypothetical protein
MGERETVLLDYYRGRAARLQAETKKLIESPAKEPLDPDLSVEPSTGVRLYDRVRDMRASFAKNFPQLAAELPSMSYHPTGDCLPDGSLDRNDLRALVADLDKFLRLLPHRVSRLTT